MPPDPVQEGQPGPSRTGDQNQGQKRGRSGSGEPSTPPPSKKQRNTRSSQSYMSQKKPTQPHKLTKKDYPEDAKHMKAAMELHIRILWELLGANDVPTLPSRDAIRHFQSRYTTKRQMKEIIQALKAEPLEFEEYVRNRRIELFASRTMYAKKFLAMDDSVLATLYSLVHESGLRAFRPDITGGSHKSMYNMAHQTLAIFSFQTACNMQGYNHVTPNLQYVNDIELLGKFYRNFVYHYMTDKLRSEMRKPGSIAQTNANTNVYRRRDHLSSARTRWEARAHGSQDRLQRLTAEAAANSDDEAVVGENGKLIYYRKKKAARNQHATDHIRQEDRKRLQARRAEKGLGSNIIEERDRQPDPMDRETTISRKLPKYVPLDWFDPTVFNALPAGKRYKYRNNGIALPAAHKMNNIDPRWRTMPDEEFNKEYGDEVKKNYTLPTDEEMASIKENRRAWGWSSDEEDEDEDEEDEDTEDEDAEAEAEDEDEDEMETDG